jgi:hypothetical protein
MPVPESDLPAEPLQTPLGEGNLTLRIDQGVLLWARVRALQNGSNVNREIRRFLEGYAAVPRWWLEGRPEPKDDRKE